MQDSEHTVVPSTTPLPLDSACGAPSATACDYRKTGIKCAEGCPCFPRTPVELEEAGAEIWDDIERALIDAMAHHYSADLDELACSLLLELVLRYRRQP